jgi:riboflavin kinase
MIAPDVWFTLYVLAQEGAVHKRAVLTTRKLGNLLGVSQQTASRRVTYCAEEGYVSRVHTANGMLIQLSKKGVKELKGVMTGLELALVPREEEIVIAGRVVHGLGEGAYYVDAYSPRFHESLGFEPYSGTLNVKIVDDDSRSAINRMKQTPPLIVPGFTHEAEAQGQ